LVSFRPLQRFVNPWSRYPFCFFTMTWGTSDPFVFRAAFSCGRLLLLFPSSFLSFFRDHEGLLNSFLPFAFYSPVYGCFTVMISPYLPFLQFRPAKCSSHTTLTVLWLSTPPRSFPPRFPWSPWGTDPFISLFPVIMSTLSFPNLSAGTMCSFC